MRNTGTAENPGYFQPGPVSQWFLSQGDPEARIRVYCMFFKVTGLKRDTCFQLLSVDSSFSTKQRGSKHSHHILLPPFSRRITCPPRLCLGSPDGIPDAQREPAEPT